MTVKTLISLRPVMMDRLLRDGEPYVPADAKEEQKLLETDRWKVATKEDLEAWKTRLSTDPALELLLGADASVPPLETEGATKEKAAAKSKAEAQAAEAKAKEEEEARLKAEAEAKAKADAEAAAAAAGGDGKAGEGGAAPSTGPGGIG